MYWEELYRGHTFGENLARIHRISNYTPFYNYFIILIKDVSFDLFLIKLLSFVFEIGGAIIIMLIAKTVTKKRVSPIWFGVLMLIPPFLMNSSIWGQCDAIYTFFGILGFYLALKKQSFYAFIAFGASFAIKLQSVFIMPIILVFLITKHLKWRYVPIIPVMYFVINCLPLLVGTPFLSIALFYLWQTQSYDYKLSQVYNIPWLFESFALQDGYTYAFMLVGFVSLTLGLVLYVVWRGIKTHMQRGLEDRDFVLLTAIITATITMFLPKMLERFYYYTVMFAVLWVMCGWGTMRFRILVAIGLSAPLTIMSMDYLFWKFYRLDEFIITNVFLIIAMIVAFSAYAFAWFYLVKDEFFSCYVVKGEYYKSKENLDKPLVDAQPIVTDVHTESMDKQPNDSERHE